MNYNTRKLQRYLITLSPCRENKLNSVCLTTPDRNHLNVADEHTIRFVFAEGKINKMHILRE